MASHMLLGSVPLPPAWCIAICRRPFGSTGTSSTGQDDKAVRKLEEYRQRYRPDLHRTNILMDITHDYCTLLVCWLASAKDKILLPDATAIY